MQEGNWAVMQPAWHLCRLRLLPPIFVVEVVAEEEGAGAWRKLPAHCSLAAGSQGAELCAPSEMDA